MSMSEGAPSLFEALAADVAGQCDSAVETSDFDVISDERLGRLFVSAARLIAAKALAGTAPQLAHGNHTLSATDGMIACTAILESVDLEVFELSAWQALTNVGSRSRQASPKGKGRNQ